MNPEGAGKTLIVAVAFLVGLIVASVTARALWGDLANEQTRACACDVVCTGHGAKATPTTCECRGTP